MKKKLVTKKLKLTRLQVKVLDDREAPAWAIGDVDLGHTNGQTADVSASSFHSAWLAGSDQVFEADGDYAGFGSASEAALELGGAASQYCGAGTYCAEGTYSAGGAYSGGGTYCGEGTYCGTGTYCGDGAYSGAGTYCGDGTYCGEGTYCGDGQYCGEGTYCGGGSYCGEGVYCGSGTYSAAGTYCGGGAYCGGGTYCGNGYYCGNGTYCGDGSYSGSGYYASYDVTVEGFGYGFNLRDAAELTAAGMGGFAAAVGENAYNKMVDSVISDLEALSFRGGYGGY